MSDFDFITTLFLSGCCIFLSDLDRPSQGPVKTSSPIVKRKAVDVRVNNNKQRAISPILLLCEDDTEQAKLQPFQGSKCIRWVIN